MAKKKEEDSFLNPLILDGTAITIPKGVRSEMDLEEDDYMMMEKTTALPNNSKKLIQEKVEELEELTNGDISEDVKSELQEIADELGNGVSEKKVWAFFPATVMKKD